MLDGILFGRLVSPSSDIYNFILEEKFIYIKWGQNEIACKKQRANPHFFLQISEPQLFCRDIHSFKTLL